MAPTEPRSVEVVRPGGVAGAATSAPTPDCKPVAAAALEACWLAESTGTWPEAATAHRLLAGISIYTLRGPLAVVGPLLAMRKGLRPTPLVARKLRWMML